MKTTTTKAPHKPQRVDALPVKTIVAEHRAEHGAKPTFNRPAPSMPTPEPIKPAFVPFPPGTVRGPYTCGKGTDPKGGVQFLVQTVNGWVPFIRANNEEKETEQEARAFAAEVLEKEKTRTV